MVYTMNYDVLFEFEAALADYTGAPYAVVTDGCSHAVELCLRYDGVKRCEFTPFTYVSIPQVMHILGIDYQYLDHEWQRWIGEYQFIGTRIWDSARRLERGMYRAGQMQCLSFGNGKPLTLGKVGAILLDDADAYQALSCMRSDGRDLRIHPWVNQNTMSMGFHYFPTLESVALGLELLPQVQHEPVFVAYPDCRKILIQNSPS